MEGLSFLRASAKEQLTGNILPYWSNMAPDVNWGGFLGRIDFRNRVVPSAPKGAVLNTRVLWAFSSAHCFLGEHRLLSLAQRAKDYLVRYFWDARNGGIYWMLDHRGKPIDTKKQVYAQAFAIYALSAHFSATKDQDSLSRAIELFKLIEKHSFDPKLGGYFEAFDKDWGPLDDVRLSDKDQNARKTMNTHLHLLEAYTSLLKIWSDERLKEKLAVLLDLFLSRILNPETRHLQLFFDEFWNSQSEKVSFGHDIEASWLLTEAAEAIGCTETEERAQSAALEVVEVTLNEGMDDGGIRNERLGDQLDEDRHWWPQAEAVVALVNAFSLTRETRLLELAVEAWDYLLKNLVDEVNGEWHFRVSKNGVPYSEEDKAGPWKGPYHNSRACLELISRADRLHGAIE
jgi:mannobiose 2-epimerase